ncbi:D-alanine--D-alanine ligase [Corticibacter populi]|uniref:D-alanine--D-alanine ligase n=1 Tax=Corticibacter populi TaxID=1550736 RepID=A0A3M6QM79_9BURK|nr:D-alanine--D-alanine ligase [Corticibacter populi]RMX04055.1 D-alanine--D-alanine ligase [Corticibacter populi]RZS33056.1 D-alanine-D-alanine ligase [Corticibacter populi]
MSAVIADSIDVRSLGKVAVLLGGSSAERAVSLMSGQGVLKALRTQGVDAHPFDTGQQSLWQLKEQGFARVFIALHGRGGEDGTVQGALELLGIPYTGPGVAASAMAMDKVLTKRLWRADGLATPDWRLVDSAEGVAQAFAALGAPMIVKPAREGSTIGLAKVELAEECAAAYALAAGYDDEVLCEQFIEGEETTCAIIELDGKAEALPVIRIVAPGGNYDYENKYFGDATQYFCPSGLPDALEQQIRQMSLAAFQSLGCRGWARADVMIRKSDGKAFLLEINTSPGMTSHSLVPMAAGTAGISYEALCLRILAAARLDGTLLPTPHAPGAAESVATPIGGAA